MASVETDVTKRLQSPINALLAFPEGTVITNHFILDTDDDEMVGSEGHDDSGTDCAGKRPCTHTTARLSVADQNRMADAVERLVTEVTYVLSVGLVERHELWTVLETLSLVPEKVALEASLGRASSHGVSPSDARRTCAPETHAPSEGTPSHDFSRRVQFASQLIFVVQRTFKDYPAPARTRALLRLALNQGCLLAALELIARYNRAEIVVYYSQPWRSVLLQYDALDLNAPGLDDAASVSASASRSASVGGRWSWLRARPQGKSERSSVSAADAVASHHTPLRPRPAAPSLASPSTSPRPRAPPAAAQAAARTTTSALWGTFVATLSPVGGVPLCALEDGSMTKGFSLVPFALQLVVVGLDDDLPFAAGSATRPGTRLHRGFLHLLGEYIYDMSPTAPSAYACWEAACARGKPSPSASAVPWTHEPDSAGSASITAQGREDAASAVMKTNALVQVLPTSRTRSKRTGMSTAGVGSATGTVRASQKNNKKKPKIKSVVASTITEPSTRPPSSASSGSTERHGPHSRTETGLAVTDPNKQNRGDDEKSDQVDEDATVMRPVGTAHAAVSCSAEVMQRYVAAVTQAEARAEGANRPLVAQFRLLKRLSQLDSGGATKEAGGGGGGAGSQNRVVDDEAACTTSGQCTIPPAACSTQQPAVSSSNATAVPHFTRASSRRGGERSSFELLPDGSVVRCAARSSPSPPPTQPARFEPLEAISASPSSSAAVVAEVMAELERVEAAVRDQCLRMERASARQEAIAMGRYDMDAAS